MDLIDALKRPEGKTLEFKREGAAAGVHVRVGSTNRRADGDMIEELRRFGRGEAYDEQEMPDSALKHWTSERLPSRSPQRASRAVGQRHSAQTSACRDVGMTPSVLEEFGTSPQDPKRRYFRTDNE